MKTAGRRPTEAQYAHRRKIHGPAIELAKARLTAALETADALISGAELGRKGGARPGAGAKPKHGKAMPHRSIRWDDEGWADAKLIGHDRVRELVRQDAERQRLVWSSAAAQYVRELAT